MNNEPTTLLEDFFLLVEAPGDDPNQGGEPMEDDIAVGDDIGEPGGDDFAMDDMGDDTGDMGDDLGGMDSGENPKESLTGDSYKKRQLLKSYNKILVRAEKLIGLCDRLISYSRISDDAKDIFRGLKQILEENVEKIHTIINELFLPMEYKKLLTLFLYIKMTVLNAAEIIKRFISNK